MNLLRAVNAILPSLGEHTVTSVDAKHPTVAVIINALNLKLDDILLRGWWFNTYEVDLLPGSEGEIDLPVDTLDVQSLSGRAVQRGRRLYNQETRTYKFPVGQAVPVRIMERVQFDDLPENVARFVMYEGMVAAYRQDIGMESVLSEWKVEAAQALNTVEAAHLRHMKYTSSKSRRFRNLRNALRG